MKTTINMDVPIDFEQETARTPLLLPQILTAQSCSTVGVDRGRSVRGITKINAKVRIDI